MSFEIYCSYVQFMLHAVQEIYLRGPAAKVEPLQNAPREPAKSPKAKAKNPRWGELNTMHNTVVQKLGIQALGLDLKSMYSV